MKANSARHALDTVLCYVRLTSGIHFSLLLEQGPKYNLERPGIFLFV